jgi:toxin-antitoxin system PIN domain toxin
MILPDVNVLIYAFRQDAPQHAVCRSWLNGVVAADARFGISKLALAAVVRVITNPRIHRAPASLVDAFAFCENLLQQPHCVVVEPGDRHWEILRRLCTDNGIKGPGVTDAWYAALAIEWACEWVTCDRDFLKFPELNCTILSASST